MRGVRIRHTCRPDRRRIRRQRAKTTRMERLLTAAQRLRPERRHLLSDSIAGLTFAVVNVPQAMAHALLATVNPMHGHLHVDGRRAHRRRLHQLRLHERVQHRRAVGGRRRRAGRHPCRPEAGGAGRAGAAGGRDPAADGLVPAGFPDPFRLWRGDDRLSQRSGRADHPGPVERPDGLQERILQPGRPGVRSSPADRPDRRAGDDHRRVDAGPDGAAAADAACGGSPSSSPLPRRPSCWPS